MEEINHNLNLGREFSISLLRLIGIECDVNVCNQSVTINKGWRSRNSKRKVLWNFKDSYVSQLNNKQQMLNPDFQFNEQPSFLLISDDLNFSQTQINSNRACTTNESNNESSDIDSDSDYVPPKHILSQLKPQSENIEHLWEATSNHYKIQKNPNSELAIESQYFSINSNDISNTINLPAGVTVHGIWEQNSESENMSDCECDSVDLELGLQETEEKYDINSESFEGLLFDSKQFFDCLKNVELSMNLFYQTRNIQSDLQNQLRELINCIGNRQLMNKEQLVSNDRVKDIRNWHNDITVFSWLSCFPFESLTPKRFLIKATKSKTKQDKHYIETTEGLFVTKKGCVSATQQLQGTGPVPFQCRVNRVKGFNVDSGDLDVKECKAIGIPFVRIGDFWCCEKEKNRFVAIIRGIKYKSTKSYPIN